MSQAYEILSVGDPRQWSSEKFGGRYLAYPLFLKGVQGEVEWSRKEGSPEPQVGDEIIGDIQGSPHGPKIKVDWDAMKEKRGNSQGNTRSYKPEHVYDPAKTARITRSHAQKVAVELLTSTDGFVKAPPEEKQKALVRWTDFFESDVEEAAAQAAQRPSQKTTPTPESAPTEDPEPVDESIPF